MELQPGLVVGVRLEFVKLGVFLVFDLVLGTQPEGRNRVDVLAVEIDRERHERAVAFEDGLDLVFLGVVFAVVFELNDNLGAAAFAFDLVNGVGTGSVAGPDVSLLLFLPGAGVDLDRLGDHEGRVEPDAELTDEVVVLGAALLDGLEEGLGAGMGDGAEEFDQLVAGHPDAVVLDREGLGLVVGGEVDLEFQLVVDDLFLGNLRVAELLERIGRVGDEFANENLLLGVERMDDDIEQLLDLGLEFVGFRHVWIFGFGLLF